MYAPFAADAGAPAGATKHIFHFGHEEKLYDFITSEALVSNTSCRPLHDLALCTEAVRVGQMLYAIRQCRRESKPPSTERRWKDLGEQEAEERVMEGESLLVLGIAGTGKTTFVQGIVERLRKGGKKGKQGVFAAVNIKAGGFICDYPGRFEHNFHLLVRCWDSHCTTQSVSLFLETHFTCVRPRQRAKRE